MNTVGEMIKGIREKNGLSQNKLSEESGVSRSYLIEIEEGKYNITVDILCKIAKALKVTPNDLIPKEMYK